ncbi:MAG: hypothetical protein VB066_05280 [Paludibacter sp.]|nr:hypothetical protein [Paludibacter sp.]
MWSELKLEIELRNRLYSEFSKEIADEHWASYINARTYILSNITKEIKGVDKGLTDHSEDHLAHVMSRAFDLIEDCLNQFSAIELYILCHVIILHDVGNIHGRKHHTKTISTVYNSIRNNDPKYSQERIVVLKIAGAHGGKTKNNDNDTIVELDENSSVYNSIIRPRILASILRFADELAEGYCRTSSYLLSKQLYPVESRIYHYYASVTYVNVDKGNNRIAVTYNIDYPLSELQIEEFLSFIYRTILKLDEERRYCKYYCDYLSSLKKTEIKFNFTINGNLCDFDIPKIELEDKYNFIDDTTPDLIDKFVQIYPSYKINSIVESLHKILTNEQ